MNVEESSGIASLRKRDEKPTNFTVGTDLLLDYQAPCEGGRERRYIVIPQTKAYPMQRRKEHRDKYDPQCQASQLYSQPLRRHSFDATPKLLSVA